MTKVKLQGEDFERLVCNPEEDNCPICNTPLADVGFEWNILHGEARSLCCHADYQLKGLHADPKKDPTGEKQRYYDSLNTSDRIEFKIDTEWILPIRQAMQELNARHIDDPGVYKRAKEIRETQPVEPHP
jgi:hypothetical protein